MTQPPDPPSARRPAHKKGHVWWRVVRRVWAAADRLNLGLVAAGVAFYALVSVFPAIAALIAIWGYVADPVVIQDQLDIAKQLLPDDAFSILQEQIFALVSANESTLKLTSLLSILLAVGTARAGVAAMIRGLNSIYNESHRRNPFRRFAVAILLTLLLILIAILAIAAVVIMPSVLAYLSVRAEIEVWISMVKWVVILSVVLLGIGVLYRFGPNRRGARASWVTPGAVFALALWTSGSIGLSAYLRNFGSFNEVYGSLGAVIALLFWFYLSAYVVLLGAQLNAELEGVAERSVSYDASNRAGYRNALESGLTSDASDTTDLAEESSASRPAKADDG